MTNEYALVVWGFFSSLSVFIVNYIQKKVQFTANSFMALYFGYYVRKLLFIVKNICILNIYIYIKSISSNVMWYKVLQFINNTNEVEKISVSA